MKATLIRDNEWERDYLIDGGRIITLKLEEDLSEITFWEGDKHLGNYEDFVFYETPSINDSYLLARMYVPIKDKGLGRAAVQFFKDVSGAQIYCRPNDGIVRDDGSHLTEDAPGFVYKMQKEGLISEEGLEDEITDEW